MNELANNKENIERDFHKTNLSGYILLDQATWGFLNGELIILAGDQASGKTTFALNISRIYSTDFASHILYFSVDQSARKIIKQFNLTFDKDDKAEFAKYFHLIEIDEFNRKVFTDTCTTLNQDSKTRMIFVDYLDYTAMDEKSLFSDIQFLKKQAQSLVVPIILLLNMKNGEKQAQNLPPQLSDLGEAADTADMVLSIRKIIGTGVSDSMELSLITILKNPFEDLETIPLRFDAETSIISDHGYPYPLPY